jgi:FkbM family methyltransferase
MPTMRELAVSCMDRVPQGLIERVKNNPRMRDAFRPLVNRLVPNEPTEVTVRSGGGQGLRLLIDAGREKFYWTGAHEPHMQKAIRDVLRPGMTYWDVGAHIGYFALQAARIVGPSGSVVAFEPMPDNVERLQRNVELNGLDNVTIVRSAVSSTSGELPIYACQDQSRSTSTLMWTLDPNIGQRSAGVVPVDTLDHHLNATAPDLVKIDAEGVEVEVLRGASALIGKRGTVFLVEFTSDELLAEGQALLAGYAFKALGNNHWLFTPSHVGPSWLRG